MATAAVWLAGRFPDNDTSLLEAKLAGLEQRVRDMATPLQVGGSDTGALDDLRERLAKLEAAVSSSRPAGLDPAVANRIAAIEGGVKALDESVGILGRRSDEAVATAREARQRADTTATALTSWRKGRTSRRAARGEERARGAGQSRRRGRACRGRRSRPSSPSVSGRGQRQGGRFGLASGALNTRPSAATLSSPSLPR